MSILGGMSRRCPALMIQGTASNVGKSLLVAALCRVFLRDGLRPAPFKAQNMALNSAVTDGGEEIGRAQALQALAAGLRPDARMNPVLLKPSSDTGAQVVVMGRPVGNMRADEYLRYKRTAGREARRAYYSLAAESGVMVLEGAGSPAEINLRAHDIVNMSMARHARAKVLLAADIDRGGAFAALLGTWELLRPWERGLTAGFVLNKFRGDAGLLAPALREIGARAGRPFFGVVPWLPDLGLPEEDGFGFRAGELEKAESLKDRGGEALDLALVDLPCISNFTDFDPFRAEPDVRLRVVRRPEDLGRPDAVFLPGSKNCMGDMRRLESGGMAARLREAAKAAAAGGGPVLVGVCGGLQMLGLSLGDPGGVEGGGCVPGLGLLPLRTELAGEKTVRRCRARHLPTGIVVEGYEIHHGLTLPDGPGALPFMERAEGGVIGWAGEEAKGEKDPWPALWGCYLHGLFDSGAFRRAFLDDLRRRRGLAPLGRAAPYELDASLNRLAEAVRAHLDMPRVYGLLGL
jgi:adenosylcobyric acid synthase